MFPYLSHVQVFSCDISSECCLKYLYSCFSYRLSFLIDFVVLMLTLSVLFLVTVIILSFLIFLSHCTDASTLTSVLANHLPPFLNTYHLSASFLEWKALCITICFLVLGFIYLSSFPVHINIGPRYLTRGIAQDFIPLLLFLLQHLVYYYYYYYYYLPISFSHQR